MYNVLAMNPVIVGALTFGLVLITYPHANLWLCFIIAGVFCCFEAIDSAHRGSVSFEDVARYLEERGGPR
jgi:hypothetical protein